MTAYGLSVLLVGVPAACGRGGSDGDDGHAGMTGGTTVGMAGRAGTPSSGGVTAASGASSGGSSTSGASGRSSTSGASGTSSSGGAAVAGASGVAGTLGTRGGAAGRSGSAGSSGTAPSEAGASTQGGAAGTAGTPSAAGSAGQDAAGASGESSDPVGLSWPIDCIPNDTCVNLDYPDIDADGQAHDCTDASYVGHEGTDIGITFDAEAAGTAVRAAADGVVLFAFDGKYDQCPDDNEPDCQTPASISAGAMTGNTVCTPLGPYCGTGSGSCFWCFAGGNVLVIRHEGVPGVFATRYDHLKRGSVRVEPGDTVTRGEKIAEASSAGNSTGPHLHFEVWSTGFYELGDPWAGPCGPNTGPSLWAYDPPWLEP